MLSALIGITIVIVFSKTLMVLYVSSAFLFTGSILGLAYALRPRVKPNIQQISGLSGFEFIGFVVLTLEYYYSHNIELALSAIILSVAFLIPTICGFYVVTNREKR